MKSSSSFLARNSASSVYRDIEARRFAIEGGNDGGCGFLPFVSRMVVAGDKKGLDGFHHQLPVDFLVGEKTGLDAGFGNWCSRRPHNGIQHQSPVTIVFPVAIEMTHGGPESPASILALHSPRDHLVLRVVCQIGNTKDGCPPGIVFTETDPIVELFFKLKRGDTVGDGMVGLSGFDFGSQRLDCGVPASFSIVSLPVKIATSPFENLGTVFVRSKSGKMNGHKTTALASFASR